MPKHNRKRTWNGVIETPAGPHRVQFIARAGDRVKWLDKNYPTWVHFIIEAVDDRRFEEPGTLFNQKAEIPVLIYP